MKAIYKLPLKEPVAIEDQWAISVLDGGEFQFQLEEEEVTHFVISFTDQPIEHGFRRADGYKEGENAAITWKDPRRSEMQQYFSRVLAFLQCDYDINADIEEIECWYAAESDEEKQVLASDIHGLAFSKLPEKEIIYVDHKSIGAAVFAAESDEAPFLVADLTGMARRAMRGGRFIDSFRYSFLLIEFLFGKGKFRNTALKASFKASDELRSAVDRALSDPMLLQGVKSEHVQSKINALKTFDAIVDYIVDERGTYFHGNQIGPNAWTPDKQTSAEAVCRLAMAIVRAITYDQVKNIFSNDNWKRYEDSGIAGGAILPTKIVFKGLDIEGQIKKTFNTEHDFLAIKSTPKHSVIIAIYILDYILEEFPTLELESVLASNKETGDRIMSLDIGDLQAFNRSNGDGSVCSSSSTLQYVCKAYNPVEQIGVDEVIDSGIEFPALGAREITQLTRQCLMDFQLYNRPYDLIRLEGICKESGFVALTVCIL